MHRAALLLLALVACSKSATTTTTTNSTPAAECKKPPNAKPIELWAQPPCSPKAPTGDRQVITSEEAWGQLFSCKSGLDFTKEQVVVMILKDSPGSVGFEIYDDGQKVTFLRKETSACPKPKTYPPTPGPDRVLTYRVPAGSRTFATDICAIKPNCD